MKIIFKVSLWVYVLLFLFLLCSCGRAQEPVPVNPPAGTAGQEEQTWVSEIQEEEDIAVAVESGLKPQAEEAPESEEKLTETQPAPVKTAGPEEVQEAESLYEQGFQTYMAWRLDEALQLFDRAISIDPLSYKAYSGKGIVLCYKKNYREGMSLITRALEIKPDFTYANFNMALAYKLQKDYTKALEWFNRAISYDDKDTWSYFGIACIYAEWENADKAVEYLGKAIETDPGVKEVAQREKDLDPIRNDPRFIGLVNN